MADRTPPVTDDGDIAETRRRHHHHHHRHHDRKELATAIDQDENGPPDSPSLHRNKQGTKRKCNDESRGGGGGGPFGVIVDTTEKKITDAMLGKRGGVHVKTERGEDVAPPSTIDQAAQPESKRPKPRPRTTSSTRKKKTTTTTANGLGLGFDMPLLDEAEEARDDDADADGDGDGDGCAVTPDAELVRVVHPKYIEIEDALGEPRPEDLRCYMCDNAKEVDDANLPAEVRELKHFIAEKRGEYTDRLVFARIVQEKFDALVRRPAMAYSGDTSNLPEWTIRAIYEHLTGHDGTTESLMDSELADMGILLTVLKKSMYLAPAGRVKKGRCRPEDIVIDDKRFKQYTDTVKLVNATVVIKERFHVDQPMGMKSSALGSSSGGGNRGKRGVKSVETKGSVHETSMATLLRGTGIQWGTLGSSNSTDSRTRSGFYT
jgi:hypothetical protein